MFPISSLPRTFQHTLLSVALAAGAVAAVATAPSALAAAPMVKTQAPGYYRVMLGDFEITALSDGTVDLPVDQLLHEPAEKTQAALARAFVSAPLETSVNAYLINTGSKLVLIDSGAGALFGPTLGKLTANLQAAGYQPGQVDEVVLTHFHPDHLGGLVAQGALAFPNATLHADKRDSDFWLSKERLDAAPAESKDFFKGAMASVNPWIAAGRYQAFSGATDIVPGVKAQPAYGHTAGHTVYAVESRGQKLLLVGDLIHVAAVQFDHPEVTIGFDSDPKQASVARDQVFSQAVRDGTLIAASHLQFPGIGHLRAADGDSGGKRGRGTSPKGRDKEVKAYDWIPVNYTTQFK